MKKKYFLRGLGIGIIVTALLLCIFYRKHMTDMAVIEKAKQLGMVFPEKAEEITPAAIAAPAEPNVVQETKVPEQTAAPKVTTSPKPTEPPETTTNPEATKPPKKANSAKASSEKKEETSKKKLSAKSVTIKVVSGMDSSRVAKKLQEAGIIKSASELDSYLVKNGYANRIVIGSHKIPKNAGYKEIAKILTK
ncbi:MAG: hypothetical protein J6I65_04715 [Lachnospiraceae bacterium]|nr:hypothetical protein [Lachnospiraceae bacterium]